MKNSHLPFTVSARRLAALHATLDEWCRALAPHDDDESSELRLALIDVMEKTLRVIVTREPVTSARRHVAICLLYNGEVGIDFVASYASCPRRTAQTYLASFVSEGWVQRVKPGVYALKIP